MEHISFRPQIVGLLRRLHSSRCLLAVSDANDPRIYNSALLEIDPDHDFVLLDELTPEDGHHALLEHRHCRVRAELKGITLAFAAALLEAGSRDGIAYYRVEFPASVHYGQRRAHYRPRVSHSKKTAGELTLPGGRSVTGSLHDISLGGLRVRPDTDIDAPPLSTVLPCRMQFPDGGELRCTVELRFLGGGQVSHIGGRFESLSPTSAKPCSASSASWNARSSKKLRVVTADRVAIQQL